MLIVVTCHICSPTDSFKPQLMFHCCSVTQSCPTFCDPMDSSMPGFPFLHHSPSPRVCSDSRPLSWWCHPAISSSAAPFSSHLQSFPALGSFPVSWLCIRWPKYWSFSFSISPPNEYSGLISFRIDWFDPLAVQGTVKSLLQQDNSKASILWHTAFFTVQLSHLYTTTGKNSSLTKWTSIGKLMSLLFNMLSRSVIVFLPSSKHLLISWLQSPSAVILEPKKMKSYTVSTFPPTIWREVIGLDAMIFIFWMLFYASFFTLLFHHHQEVL